MKLQNKHLYGLIAIVTVAAIVILYFTVQKTKPVKPQKSQNNFSNFNEQVLSDKQKIKLWVKQQPEDASLQGLANALVRVSQSGEKEAEDWIVLFSQHKNSELKIGAAKAASYLQNEKSLAVLKTLAADPDAEVRATAVRGIGNSNSPEAIRWLESKEGQKFKSKKEHIEWLGSQLKRDPTDKNIQALSKYILSVGKNNNEEQQKVKRLAFERLLVGAPKAIKTQEILQKIIYSGQDLNMTAASIRHLAIFKDKWLNNSIKWLLKHENKTVRAASVQAIHRLCPPNHWDLLKEVWNRDSVEIKRVVLKEIQVLPGPEATRFLNEIKKNLNPDLMDLVSLTETKLQSLSAYNNPCNRN